LQKAFFGLFDGSTADRWGWLTPVEVAAEVAASEEKVAA
jgi:branched-chain amino acid aminotransferase